MKKVTEESHLWEYFYKRKVALKKPFGTVFNNLSYASFLWVSRSDFELVKDLFNVEFNAFHTPGKSYRSSGYFYHIHAVDEGDVFCIHRDFGNQTKFLPLGLLHLLHAFPALVYCWFSGINPGDLSRLEYFN